MPNLLPYNRNAGVAYARKWALGRNPAYYSFDKLGGDCTNFISQCLYAGAKHMNYTPTFGWYYNSLNSRSPSWTGAIFLNRFLLTNKSSGPQGKITTQSDMEPGDIIQLQNETGRIYHSLYVLTANKEILVAAHDDNALYRPLSTYQYTNAIYIKITGVGN
ncbi:amidase domain-containing protein [[Clostridium] polysaccharolyticum]|uniref:Putative amidase domain-containing protein n=1 Tax=[Clostridium] polysaccharolyticum TaxID=29364 RepID=A0A1I0CZU3_9FIRM|nr:amidase domain-containing protein [[Clostridium] polysaccharolyticum]SET25182.1 Putative amidase domain-containing protein [[Clostridium] polysaccharolyticum]